MSTGEPSEIVSFPNNGFTYLLGVSDFVFNRYTSSGIASYRADLGRWTDVSETATSTFSPTSFGGPFDGFDYRSIVASGSGAADLYQTKLGNDDVLFVGGYFRSGKNMSIHSYSSTDTF